MMGLAIAAAAQHGRRRNAGGGVGGGPLPTLPDQSSISYWFRSDRDVFSDAGTTPAANGEPVHQWGNSGNLEDASQPTEANRPIFRTGGLNGMPYLECPVTDQRFFNNLQISHSGTISSIPSHRSMAFVLAGWDKTKSFNPVTGGSGGGKFDSHINVQVNTFRWFKSGFSHGVVSDPMIVIVSMGGDVTQSQATINGVHSTINNSANASSNDPGSMEFLRNQWTGLNGNNFFDGQIYEAIIWGNNAFLSEAERTEISNALNAQYAIY